MNICSVRWKTPTSVILAGPSGSGKTHFLKNLLKVKSSLFDPPPSSTIFFYKVYQEHYDDMKTEDPSIFFIDELPQSIESFKSLVEPYRNKGSIVIFDDYESEIIKNISLFSEIWTVLSHHMNCTPLAVLHNLFAKEIRTISLNTHRIILTKSLRDSAQISYLSRQCYPHIKNFLPAVYKYCMTLQDYPYLILNFSPGRESDNYIKVFTAIFEKERPMLVFKEDKCYTGKGGNPYEKLVLLNQNLYNLLKQSGGFSDSNFKEGIPQQTTSSVSNVNNIELNNDSIEENGSPYRNKLEHFDEDNKNDEIYSSQDYQSDVSNESKNRSSLSFKLPPIEKVFEKPEYGQEKLQSKIKNKRLKKRSNALGKKYHETLNSTINPVERGEDTKENVPAQKYTKSFSEGERNFESNNTSQDIAGRTPATQSYMNAEKEKRAVSKPITKQSRSKCSKRFPKGEKRKNCFKENQNAKKKYRVLNTNGKNISHSNNEENGEQNGKSQSSRETSENNLKVKFKKTLKRKANPVFNREIHPFKASKRNRGDKRKHSGDSIRKKLLKTGYEKLSVDPSLYQKWNF